MMGSGGHSFAVAAGGMYRRLGADENRNRRFSLAVAAFCLGCAASATLLLLSANPSLVLIPASYGLLAALLLLPFPQADYAFAFCVVAPFPLLPPFANLPNLPVGIGVIGLALLRIGLSADPRPRWIAFLPLGTLWALIAAGTLLAALPPFGVWIRPAAIIAVGAACSLLGVLVWSDPGRRARWLNGLMWVLLVSVTGGLIVFLLQYVVYATSVVNGLADVLGLIRGDAAGQKFAVANNWLIWGQTVTLRAVSPLFPSPNNLGGLIGLLIPFALVLSVFGTSLRSRLVAGLALSTSVTGLVVTYSRSSELAACTAGLVVVLLAVHAYRSQEGSRMDPATLRTRAAIAVVLVVIGLGLGSVGFLTAHGSISNDPGLQPDPLSRLTDPLGDPSVTTRIEIVRSGIERLTTDPLHGAGLGNWAVSANEGPRAYVHNVYLEYAAAAGIFGLGWAVLLVIIPIVGGWIAAIRRLGIQEQTIAAAAAAAGVFAGVQFAFDDNMLNPQYAWLLTFVVGLSVGAWASSRRPAKA
jgi:hypothetical protein